MGETKKDMSAEMKRLLQDITEHPGCNGARCYEGQRPENCECFGCRAARLLKGGPQ